MWEQMWRDPVTIEEWHAFAYAYVLGAFNLSKQNKFEQSAKSLEKALDVYDRYPSQEYKVWRYAYKNLADTYTRIGDWDRAEILLNRVLVACEGKLSGGPPDPASDLKIPSHKFTWTCIPNSREL